MDSRLIEAENGGNWGKFMVGQWTHADLEQRSLVAVGEPLLGRTEGNLRKGQIDPRRARLVFDLQTKKGGLFEPDPAGDSNADLEASGLWVCPLFAPFLAWLYERGQAPVASLPSIFNLPPAQSKLQGYKRPGPDFAPITGIRQKLFDALKRTPPSDQPASVAQLMGFFDGASCRAGIPATTSLPAVAVRARLE